ncbi:Signal peptidase I OS=Tsukamurella paurometabola (strain ATCC 8368 / DSM / CCUG 35730 / CIP 100753 / JCM 10117 / KCTC 9821 / NBRC 16120 / NCIMB 702349 /NCTC 13040) OX=521096 GN=Tpau_1631 PE=3 SV=1 [Tsukamurella paurometabola]|uniref:Signal peptidase I n=1 Tax=Tsukamurella paurometabola (strain ATCC 8368 / DSM 20162 / CCUG 35730 / CIP 100753 / JCM 10117 / KCTC 9821 / NBRC 16120 / NCIMB 702349 / NCTC 13040) TaxID=521096 RepID=D5UYE5_TSUPD|nr:signal peptidase I [Tsukamurella paurometabola]ADG78252.1 signal peptidase I [Tsukamurella paurometabola DSM 20162]SUP30879.1 Signal peptidase I T [Tsukamurella paurometabola]
MPEQTNSQETPEPDDSASSAGGSSVSGAGEPAQGDGARGRHAGPEEVAGDDADAKKQKKTNWPLEVAVVVLVALVLTFCLQTFVGRQWYVPSESMEPTLIGCAGCTGDRIVTQKISYFTGDPQPGDVIVFKGPTSSWDVEGRPSVRSSNTVLRGIQEALSYVGLQPPDENDLVKRVVAVGGQTIQCRPETGVTVNGKKLNEPYIADTAKEFAANQDACWGKPFGPVTVPEGNVFAMGDNRMFSADSRYHIEDRLQGTIPKADIRGKVVAIIYPFDRWQTVKAINPQQG